MKNNLFCQNLAELAEFEKKAGAEFELAKKIMSPGLANSKANSLRLFQKVVVSGEAYLKEHAEFMNDLKDIYEGLLPILDSGGKISPFPEDAEIEVINQTAAKLQLVYESIYDKYFKK